LAVVNGLGTNLNGKFTAINGFAEISGRFRADIKRAPASPGAFSFQAFLQAFRAGRFQRGMRMRKPVAAEIAAQASPPSRNPADAPAQLVCGALLLALVRACRRIASIW